MRSSFRTYIYAASSLEREELNEALARTNRVLRATMSPVSHGERRNGLAAGRSGEHLPGSGDFTNAVNAEKSTANRTIGVGSRLNQVLFAQCRNSPAFH